MSDIDDRLFTSQAIDDALLRVDNEEESPDLQVLVDLEDWRKESSELQTSRLKVHYQFSPEYEKVWSKIWHDFDQLEERRHIVHSYDAAGQAPSWHPRVVAYREQIDKFRAESYYPMTESDWRLCPLSIHLDRSTGSSSQDRQFSWRATLLNWNRFRERCRGETEGLIQGRDLGFRASLSPSQRSSYNVLEDWWCSRYSPKELIHAVQSLVETRQDVIDTNPVTTSTYQTAMTDSSVYHSFCLDLFLREFNPQCWEPFLSDRDLRRLQSLRFDSARHAAAHKLSFSVLLPDRDCATSEYPQISLNDKPMVDTTSNDDTKPFYLWDSEGSETVEVSSLAQCPQYTCISHTWGRWRIDSAANITGVAWAVPENSLYDVRELPTMLAALQIRYIWFDLFCIPQDGSERANIEISRQSTIFKGSEACIAWFHDVASWSGVNNALDWLGLQYLAQPPGRGENTW